MIIVGNIGSILVTAAMGENDDVIVHILVDGLNMSFMKWIEYPFYCC